MTGVLKVDDIQDAGANSIVSSNGSGTLTFGSFSAPNITASTAILPDASDGAAIGSASLEWSDIFLADGAVINLGDDQDVTLTHVADTGIQLNSTMKLMFNDASQYIQGASATVLDIAATDEIELTATLIEVVGNATVSGTLGVTGVLTGTSLDISGDIDIDGTTNLDIVDIDGAVNVAADITIASTNKIIFNDASQFIQGASNTVLDIAATDEIELTATLVDLNGNLDVSGTTLLPTLGVITAKDLGAGIHIRTADSGASVSSEADELVIEHGNAIGGMTFLAATDGVSKIAFGDSGDNDIGMISYSHDSINALMFNTNGEEHVRFQGSTQNVNVNYGGTSITGNVALHVEGQASANSMSVKHKDTGGGTVIAFTDGDNQACGSISVNGSANTTAFNTSSDYRLKENINYDFDATTEIKKLKPAKFNWKTNPSLTIEGFLAHEVSSIVPIAVQGDKDATETKQKVVLGKNGNLWQYGIEKSDFDKLKVKWNAQTENVDEELKGATWHAEKVLPKYQSIDASKLVPLLVKTVQELEARIKTLEDA